MSIDATGRAEERKSGADLRSLAGARLAELGLPTSALEDWRYVRCDALKNDLEASTVRAPSPGASSFGSAPTLVLHNGVITTLTTIGPFALLAPERSVEALVALAIPASDDHAWLWSLADGGMRQVIRVPAGEHRLAILNQVTSGQSGWRLRLDVAANAQLDLVVRHVAVGPARSCPGIDLQVGAGAQVRISETSQGPWHSLLTSHTCESAADSTVRWVSATAGGCCVRWQTRATLVGHGASVDLHGIAVVRGDHQAHHLTRVVHAVPHTSSNQLVKAILHDKAATSFDGVVRILPGAIGSSAQQQNRNLLLSDQARADTRPQLDIKADDVQAAHGATVGQLDQEELLYLRMRGLSAAQATSLLTTGFLDEVLDLMPDIATRALAGTVLT